MSSNFKTLIFWGILACVAILLWQVVKQAKNLPEKKLTYTEFVQQIKAGKFKKVEIASNFEVKGAYTDQTATIRVLLPANNPKIYEILEENGVEYEIREVSGGNWVNILINASPFILLLGFWIFMMRQMQSGGNKALSFGKSRARLHSTQQKKVTFKDVAGVEEAKEELQEIIEFLREPQKFQKLGGRIPKGVLLIGSPGTGKTLLARAIAGEASVPFFSISGSDFVEMFVGVGASRVRDLFEQGKKNAPCIIFIDEIDAVGRHRGAGLGGGHDEREQTLNQLLVEMDGFESNEGVILVAATNRPDVLDPALLRPGRFDRRVVVDRPDVKGREAILKVHTKKIPLGDDVDLSVLARGTPGMAGADLANLVNEAALNAARQNRKVVMQIDFEQSKDKVLMGAERKSLVMSDKEKRTTAYHEAGHALVAALIPNSDPVHKVTIIPRGMALGLTQQLPIDDKLSYDKEQLEARLAILMAGRIADEMFSNQKSTGAGNDIERATDLARKMVCEWGMSELGPMSFGQKEEQIFLGREIAQHRDYSEATAIRIDEQVRRFVQYGYDVAKGIIEENRQALINIAETLLVREVLDGEEVNRIIREGVVLSATGKATASPDDGHTQQVLRPEGGRRLPGLEGERPQPA
ncbi:MAG: ATP-dependent metallopeptidase FtsH/Yme1/Tma family protein [Candidatus Solibacter usitatus]|nr:ATP-dependent metallopeptidase FtsH/Yme1/Tma family protein [Candidatus Solibacter usitatus]